MRRYGMKKRLLAAVLSVGMLGSLTAVPAFADNNGSGSSNSMQPDAKGYDLNGKTSESGDPSVKLSKTAVYNAEDDSYTITLNAATKEVVKTKPTRVVFVLDASGSMNFCTDDLDLHTHSGRFESNLLGYCGGAKDWTNCKYYKNKDHVHTWDDDGVARCTNVVFDKADSRWSIATGAIASMTEDLTEKEVNCNYVYFRGNGFSAEAESDYSDVTANGGTSVKSGIQKAQEIFDQNKNNDEDQIMIIVADGATDDKKTVGAPWNRKEVPDYGEDLANTFKKNGEIYTVGFTFRSDDFEALATDDAHKLNATDKNTLNIALNEITENIKALITDPLGDNVTLDGDVKVTVNGKDSDVAATYDEKTNTISWSNPDGINGQVTLTYTVKIKEKKVGENPLNGKASINYSDGKDGVSSDFPIPAATLDKLTVSYVNGTETVKTDEFWTVMTGENDKFDYTAPKKGATIEGDDGKTYYVTDENVDVPDPKGTGNGQKLDVSVSAEDPKPTTYTVSYKAEGLPATAGVTLPDDAQYEQGATVTLDLTAPTVDGYEFVEWQYEGIEKTAIGTTGSFTMPANAVTVKAVYKKAEDPKPTTYTVSYKAEGIPATAEVTLPEDTQYEQGKNVTIKGTAPAVEGYTFKGWKYDGIAETDVSTTGTFTMPAKDVTIIAVYEKNDTPTPDPDPEPSEEPKKPEYTELDALIDVTVKCVATGSNATRHEEMTFDNLIENTDDAISYEIGEVKAGKVTVTIKADEYIEVYNQENGEHTSKGKTTAKVKLVYDKENGWQLGNGENNAVTFEVICKNETPKDDKPASPKYDDIVKNFIGAFGAICKTDETHKVTDIDLIKESYSVGKVASDSDGIYSATVTVKPDKYVALLNESGTTHTSSDAAYVATLTWDGSEWIYNGTTTKWGKIFTAACENDTPTPDPKPEPTPDPDPTPAPDEKQYATITFKVVNGTFDENGLTEITKTFVVGTKLDTSMLPATTGNKGYSDPTWDKPAQFYTVEADGTTFVITYRKTSNGGTSDRKPTPANGGGTNGGSNVRSSATNASGKTGHWILEGGEFTENNGRLPSNEYLKIGGSIYGFYTNGFAIDFDRPEYYTDAAIAAKGGYRDAQGTWRINGWWFEYDDGTYPHNEWVYLSWNGRSDWYFFDVDGWMEDGWFNWNNNWYYLHTEYDNTRGHMYTGWHEIDGKQYYFNTASDKGTLGAMLSDTTTPDGHKVGADGARID